jgi:FtsP/CotA-like multicopper oxidase with cupredoxin domain
MQAAFGTTLITMKPVQMERGMYGAIIVEDESDPVVDGEKVFLIDDMKLSANFEFTKPSWALPRLIEKHDGRQGDTLLINGKVDSLLHMHAGQVERWRFINASSARYFKLSLGGKEFKIIGTDGGLIEKPVALTEALITPGERLDIVVGPFKEGERISIDSLSYKPRYVPQAKERNICQSPSTGCTTLHCKYSSILTDN